MSLPEHDAPAPDAPETPESPDHGLDSARETLLDALPEHVVFDGWSRVAIDAAAAETDMPEDLARLAFPNGIDAAAAFHRRGDRLMKQALLDQPLSDMGMTAKVTLAIRLRLEAVEPQKEAVRRAAALFALPINAARGARLIWDTADAIWTALGDTSEDLSRYSKRATLSAVYSSTVLYWLGDESEGHEDTWAYLDRRISDVMKIEKAKAKARANPLGRMAAGGAEAISRGLKARRPGRAAG